MALRETIESLLLVADKPLAIKKIALLTGVSTEEVDKSLQELGEDYRSEKCGIVLVCHDEKYQFTTSPDNSQVVREFLQQEENADLTRAALETLTVIAYRGPISRSEIDQIRGVNSIISLRNLLVRGLIDEKKMPMELESQYIVSTDFVHLLGLQGISELPSYEGLHTQNLFGTNTTTTTNESADDSLQTNDESNNDSTELKI